MLALREHPSSCIFYKILQCAGLWFHQTSHSRLWPRSRFLPEDRKDTDNPSQLAHVPNRGHLAWLLAVEGLKATLHVLPRCWEEPFLCRSSPQPVFTCGICFDGDTDRWWVSDSCSADKIKKILKVVWFLSKSRLCLKIQRRLTSSLCPQQPELPPNLVISATREVRVPSHTSRYPWQPRLGDCSPGRRTLQKPASPWQRDGGTPEPGLQHSPSSVSSALPQQAGLLWPLVLEHPSRIKTHIIYRLSKCKSAYCRMLVMIPASSTTPACSRCLRLPLSRTAVCCSSWEHQATHSLQGISG